MRALYSYFVFAIQIFFRILEIVEEAYGKVAMKRTQAYERQIFSRWSFECQWRSEFWETISFDK
jgi:hypothetical protein